MGILRHHQCRQREHHIASRLNPSLAIFLETAADEGGERCGHMARQWGRRIVQDRVQGLERAVSVERGRPGEHLVRYDAEAEEIRPGIDFPSLDLLRRHVRHGADHESGMDECLVGEILRIDRREPEVQQLHTACRHHDVLRLQVAVNDTLGVCAVERICNLSGIADGGRDRQGPPASTTSSVSPRSSSITRKSRMPSVTSTV